MSVSIRILTCESRILYFEVGQDSDFSSITG